MQRPHPPFWLGAGSAQSIARAARDGYNLLLDQIGSIDLTIDRVAAYRAECARIGRAYEPMNIGVTRALYIVMTEAERETAYAMRAQQIKTIGGLARGPGAERFHNPANFADTNIADDDAALLGTPDEIIERLKRLEAGGIDNVLLADATASKRSLRLFASEIMPEFRTPAPIKRLAE